MIPPSRSIARSLAPKPRSLRLAIATEEAACQAQAWALRWRDYCRASPFDFPYETFCKMQASLLADACSLDPLALANQFSFSLLQSQSRGDHALIMQTHAVDNHQLYAGSNRLPSAVERMRAEALDRAQSPEGGFPDDPLGLASALMTLGLAWSLPLQAQADARRTEGPGFEGALRSAIERQELEIALASSRLSLAAPRL